MTNPEHLITHGSQCHFKSAPSDEQIILAVEAWIDLLAAGDYESAYYATWHDPYFQWSAKLIEAVINGYGLPERRRDGAIFRVSDRRLAEGRQPARVVERRECSNGVLAEAWHDLPLNGEWSDLTSTFHVVSSALGFALVLQEIHVF